MILYFLGVILALAALAAIFTFLYIAINIFFIVFVTKVPPVQTDKKYFDRIFSNLTITSETIIYDLGCGGGNFLLAAAKFKPKQCIGYELSLWPYLQALIKSLLAGQDRIQICFRDFFKVDLREADIVYVYLVPPLLGRVAQKLRQEMKSRSIAVVKGLPLPEITYDQKIILDDKRNYCAYIYKF